MDIVTTEETTRLTLANFADVANSKTRETNLNFWNKEINLVSSSAEKDVSW